MIEVKHNPTRKDLTWFGALFAVFAGVFGGLVWWRWDTQVGAYTIWGIGAAVTLIYVAVPQSRRWIYLGWNYAVFPIGWTVTHLMLAGVYYLAFTPVGLIMRMVGRDPMQRKLDREGSTYWIEHRTGTGSKARYFRQF